MSLLTAQSSSRRTGSDDTARPPALEAAAPPALRLRPHRSRQDESRGPARPVAASARRWRRQRGAAAVELAILLPILLVFLVVPFGYARFMWHYTAAQKAAHDAARYMASVPQTEIAVRSGYFYTTQIAREIAANELADISQDASPPTIEIVCEPYRCAEVYSGPPDAIRVHVSMNVPFSPFGTQESGAARFTIEVNAREKYIGRWNQ